jgi:hypothetical protein
MKLKLNTDKLKELIFKSQYKSARRFFDETKIMSRENFYQINKYDKEIKWSHLQAIADELGIDPEIITIYDNGKMIADEPPAEPYSLPDRVNMLENKINDLDLKINKILKSISTDKNEQNRQNRQK